VTAPKNTQKTNPSPRRDRVASRRTNNKKKRMEGWEDKNANLARYVRKKREGYLRGGWGRKKKKLEQGGGRIAAQTNQSTKSSCRKKMLDETDKKRLRASSATRNINVKKKIRE